MKRFALIAGFEISCFSRLRECLEALKQEPDLAAAQILDTLTGRVYVLENDYFSYAWVLQPEESYWCE